jgi:hypothetical protein
MGESTVYRHMDTVALVIGPEGDLAAHCRASLEQVMIRVVRVGHVAAAAERLPIVMPQAVLVLVPLAKEERNNLVDRAAAVGALIFDIDGALPQAELNAALDRAALEAVERGLVRDQPVTRPSPT